MFSYVDESFMMTPPNSAGQHYHPHHSFAIPHPHIPIMGHPMAPHIGPPPSHMYHHQHPGSYAFPPPYGPPPPPPPHHLTHPFQPQQPYRFHNRFNNNQRLPFKSNKSHEQFKKQINYV